MRISGPARGPRCAWRFAFCAVLAVSFCAERARSQDVAEAARQDKARKSAGQQAPPHVYTDDDLKRKVILTPEDQARVEARKKKQGSVPGEQDASAKPQQPAGDTTQTESLGEIARRYRREKAERDAALAAKKKFTPFPYSVPKDALAEPKTGSAPLTGVLPGLVERRAESATEAHPAAKVHPPVVRDHHGRISPFEPRPLIGSPVVAPPAIAVVPSQPVRPVAPMAGKEPRSLLDPANSGLKRVQVVHGDSWWKLAETYLGSGARWRELRQLNAQTGGSLESLKLGSVVVVPASSGSAKALPRRITVSKDDSLWSLSEQHLGRGSAWTCLANANPQVSDYTHLAIGTILQLPATDKPFACQLNVVGSNRR
jgi:nucleoid-associated protein YgaU